MLEKDRKCLFSNSKFVLYCFRIKDFCKILTNLLYILLCKEKIDSLHLCSECVQVAFRFYVLVIIIF